MTSTPIYESTESKKQKSLTSYPICNIKKEYLVNKDAYSIFIQNKANEEMFLELKNMKLKVEELASELSLFGKSVGCVNDACSNCGYMSQDCNCEAWTCCCDSCTVTKEIYCIQTEDHFTQTGTLATFRPLINKTHQINLARLLKVVPDDIMKNEYYTYESKLRYCLETLI